jgi:glycolate oxidase FAD binding subunit
VIAEATLKIVPLPRSRAVAVARCGSLEAAFGIADALLRTPIRPSALVVEGTRAGWVAIVGAHGDAAPVERAMTEALRAAKRAGASVERVDGEEVLRGPRELPATAADGALVRAAVPLAAQVAFANAATRLRGFVRCVADASSGIVRVHLRGDDAIADAGELMDLAPLHGGTARVERRDASLASGLRPWGPQPAAEALMRRIKDTFDPAHVLEPGRSIVG